MSASSNRIMARHVAQTREVTFEELKLVVGGGNSTTGGLDCTPGWCSVDHYFLSCDDDPCDQIATSYD